MTDLVAIQISSTPSIEENFVLVERQLAALPEKPQLLVPSAFTRQTGDAHWHALLKARSIENQCYVVASDQTGVHNNGRETYGNSCIYSPWGELLANLPENKGWVAAKYDKVLLANIRKEMPIQQHKNNRKPF